MRKNRFKVYHSLDGYIVSVRLGYIIEFIRSLSARSRIGSKSIESCVDRRIVYKRLPGKTLLRDRAVKINELLSVGPLTLSKTSVIGCI